MHTCCSRDKRQHNEHSERHKNVHAHGDFECYKQALLYIGLYTQTAAAASITEDLTQLACTFVGSNRTHDTANSVIERATSPCYTTGTVR
jgi:hypothetical protein